MLAQRGKLLLSREVRAHMIGCKHCMWNFWIVIELNAQDTCDMVTELLLMQHCWKAAGAPK